MIEALRYFVKKVCTISTIQVNFRFKEEQMMDYFMGVVESIDDDGIFIRHTQTNCKSYIFLEHVVSIAEEQVLYEANPEHAPIINEYRKEKPITSKKFKIPEQTNFANPAAMAELAKAAQSTFGKTKSP